jgi:hypothetical protein
MFYLLAAIFKFNFIIYLWCVVSSHPTYSSVRVLRVTQLLVYTGTTTLLPRLAVPPYHSLLLTASTSGNNNWHSFFSSSLVKRICSQLLVGLAVDFGTQLFSKSNESWIIKTPRNKRHQHHNPKITTHPKKYDNCSFGRCYGTCTSKKKQ